MKFHLKPGELVVIVHVYSSRCRYCDPPDYYQCPILREFKEDETYET